MGQPIVEIADGLKLRSPLLSWEETWKVLKQHVADPSPAATSTTSHQPAINNKSRRVDREGISKSTRAAVLNAVTDADYTESDRHMAMLMDGESYINEKINSKDACFFFSLEHAEGEFAVGLGRRTFDSKVDNPSAGLYEIKWYVRKNRKADWGQQPSFKWSIGDWSNARKPYPKVSVEPLTAFLPVVVELTLKSTREEPTITKACMAALRAFVQGKKGQSEGGSSEEDSKVLHIQSKRRRRSHSIIEDD